jgi:hypothetical protein
MKSYLSSSLLVRLSLNIIVAELCYFGHGLHLDRVCIAAVVYPMHLRQSPCLITYYSYLPQAYHCID